MRTDCKIKTKFSIRLPQIPLCSAGRLSSASRGDWIKWRIGELSFQGRVICSAQPDDEPTKVYLVIAMMFNGLCCERWVDPADVIDAHSVRDEHAEKMTWLFGAEFMHTLPDHARQCFELSMKQLTEQNDVYCMLRKPRKLTKRVKPGNYRYADVPFGSIVLPGHDRQHVIGDTAYKLTPLKTSVNRVRLNPVFYADGEWQLKYSGASPVTDNTEPCTVIY